MRRGRARPDSIPGGRSRGFEPALGSDSMLPTDTRSLGVPEESVKARQLQWISIRWPRSGPRDRLAEPLGRRGTAQESPDQAEVDRLHQMRVESRLPGAAPVVLLTPSGHRHEQDGLPPRRLPDLARDVIAVEPRQADVQQDDVGME